MYSGLKKNWIKSCLAVIVAMLAAVVAVFAVTVYVSYYNNLTSILITRADSSARLFRSYINTSYREFYEGAARYAESLVEKDRLECEIVDLDGKVIYSSSFALLTGYVPGTPDVSSAMEQEKTSSYVGKDSVTGQRVMSVSAPLYLVSGELVGAIRYVTGLELVNSRILTLCSLSTLVAAGGVLLVFLNGAYFLTSILNPIKRLNATAKEIASGKYGTTIDYDRDDEIGELAQSLNFLSGEIARSAKIKNEFISSVSHELRTPLTAISGWAETLMADEKDPESIQAKGLEVIQHESMRLRDMVEELLDFSRVESGRIVLNKTVFDLNAELEDTIFMLEQRLAQDGIHIVYNDGTEEALILGDPQRIRQVFVNVIDNARKFSERGSSIDITIEECAKDRSGFVAVTVKDFGCGISPEDLPHVKDKFFKGSTDKAGSGIGLALSDEIVRLHGGTLTVKSILGEGASVRIELPLA